MSEKKPMVRVSREKPCPVCNRPDWCMVGEKHNLCMRVTSSRSISLADGSIAYLHPKSGQSPVDYNPPEIVRKEFDAGVLKYCGKVFHGSHLNILAKNISVTTKSLELLGCVKYFDLDTWAFPMKDQFGNIIGARVRKIDGKKWSIPGSRNGLFIPSTTPEKTLLICEGPTDTAAALTIGMYAVGRFNCCGGIEMLVDFVRRNKIRLVYIIADCDQDRVVNEQVANPGIRGAVTLSEHMPVRNAVITLPTKDLREFVANGGTGELFRSIASQVACNNPR
jgi:hypothetical protein